MSFLNSVLSSITTGQQASASPTLPVSATTKSAVGKLAASEGTSRNPIPKRKASSDIIAANAKAPRKETQANGGEGYTGTCKPSATPPVSRPSSTGPESLPYRGTAKHAPPSTVSRPIAKPVARIVPPPSSIKSAAKPASKPSTPTNATSPAVSVAPKPGSYAAMMARAKAQQVQPVVVGAIKHKQTEKLTKKELLAQKEESRKQALASKGKQPAIVSRFGKTEGQNVKLGVAVKEKKKPVDLGYQGTMRAKPAEPSYSGTMRTGPASKSQRSNTQDRRPGEKGRDAGYSYYGEEEEDDYYSDASSDMEAGAFDLDREEQQSLRVAKKEDEEARREEDEHKRLKQQRKEQMQKLAAQAALKKKRF